jgi:D-xylose transport system permease protein
VNGANAGSTAHRALGGWSGDVPLDWFGRLTTDALPALVSFAVGGGIVLLLILQQFRNRRQRRQHELPVADGETTFLRLMIVAQLLALLILIANQHRGVPLPVVLLGLVAFGVHLLTRHMPFGRYLYAIGGNEEAARISGIPVARVTIRAFVLAGAIVGLAGLMQTAYTGSSTPDVGQYMELDAVAACVIGGVSLRGGRGTVGGVLFGALIMGVLAKGMSLLGVGPELKYIARGTVLVLAVWMDTRLSR